MYTQRRFRSTCACAQSDQSIRCPRMSEGTFPLVGHFMLCARLHVYCAFDIFQKVVFLLGDLHRRGILQTFVMFNAKICRNYLSTKRIYSSHWFINKSNLFSFTMQILQKSIGKETWSRIFAKFCLLFVVKHQ